MNTVNWRQIPAETIEEIITRYVGYYPPTFAALEELLASHHFVVICFER